MLSNLLLVTESLTLIAGNINVPFFCISYRRCTPVVVSSLTPRMPLAIAVHFSVTQVRQAPHDILRGVNQEPARNIYFELTEAFNARAPNVALASGQAVVYYRIAIMSKDGDWIIREAPDACDAVLAELEGRGARYRPAAPLDVRWLAGGWSSHFEFADARARRVRCDFVSRPPRVPRATLDQLFAPSTTRTARHVVDIPTLIALKQTQRAKDYAVIAELAVRLPPEQEIEVTTDPDRILALAPAFGRRSSRPAVRAAHQATIDRRAVVVALAEEIDAFQQA